MEEKKSAKESFKMTFPRMPPYKSVSDYHKSRATLRNIQLRRYEWDQPRHDPQLHLTETRRIYDKTEETLSEKREFHKRERVKLDEQWKELEDKEKELRQSFEKLNSFVTTNEDKRKRVQERCREAIKKHEERSREIDRLKEGLRFMEEVKSEMDEEIARHKFYEQFLNSIIEHSDEFKNPKDLTDRCESLIKTKNELGVRQNLHLQELENARAIIVKTSDQYNLLILGLNNVVGSLNTRYSSALHKAMYWEKTVWAIKNKAFRTFQEINEVKQSCWNICMLMSKRKGETLKIPEDDFDGQLAYIKKTLQELKIVSEEANIVLKKRFGSMKGQTSQTS